MNRPAISFLTVCLGFALGCDRSQSSKAVTTTKAEASSTPASTRKSLKGFLEFVWGISIEEAEAVGSRLGFALARKPGDQLIGEGAWLDEPVTLHLSFKAGRLNYVYVEPVKRIPFDQKLIEEGHCSITQKVWAHFGEPDYKDFGAMGQPQAYPRWHWIFGPTEVTEWYGGVTYRMNPAYSPNP